LSPSLLITRDKEILLVTSSKN